jgi:hypothetical protein
MSPPTSLPVEKPIMTAHRSVAVRVQTVLASITSSWVASARAAPAQRRILPTGDSSAGSPGCRGAWPWGELQSAGFARSDLAGTGPGAAADAMPWFAPSDIRYPE